MAVPKLDTPTYELKLTSMEQPITYRPFLVKEEKILLTALEGGIAKEIVKATKQIIQNCCVSDIDVNTLPAFDIELFFLHLRSRSVGANITLMAGHKDSKCQAKTEIVVNINDIKVQEDPNHNKNIKITDNIMVEMKYPDIEQMTRPPDEAQMDMMFEIIKVSIAGIYEGEEYHDVSTIPGHEIEEFIMSLNQKKFGMLINFFNTMPKLRHEVNFRCKTCQEEEVFVIEGLQNFFG